MDDVCFEILNQISDLDDCKENFYNDHTNTTNLGYIEYTLNNNPHQIRDSIKLLKNSFKE